MPNVVGLTLGQAEASLKAAGVLVPLSIGYFGGGTIRTISGVSAGAAATWPIAITWVSQSTPTRNVDGNVRPVTPGLVLAQVPAAGATIIANASVQLTAVQPAMSIAYPGTNLMSF